MVNWSQLLEEPLQYSRDISWNSKLLITLGTGAVSLGVIYWWISHSHKKKLPPGPWGLPWLGAVHQFSKDMHLDCARLRRKYGDIFSFRFGPELWVVVNGYEAIRETFIRRGEEFAGRPQSVSDLMDLDEQIFSKDYNDEWKKNKKFAMVSLRNFNFGSPKLADKVNYEINKVIETCKEKQDSFYLRPLLERASAHVISSIVLEGARPLSEEELEDLIGHSKAFFDVFSEEYILAATFLPLWLVKLLYKKQVAFTTARIARIKEFMTGKIKEHQQTLEPAHPRDVMDMYISQRLDKDMTMDQVACTNLMFMFDAILTTTQALDTFLLCVIKNKQVQKKLHEELDRVVGKSGRVSLSHKPDLPYLQAAIYETWRYAPLAPLSAAHKPISDTTLLGYHIPKNAFIMPNLHSVHSDPVTFPNPDIFDPGHFLDEDGQIVKADHCIPFSVGRRMCLGEAFAKLETFLFLANLLYEFEFSFPKDQPEPVKEYTNFGGLFYIQEPFQICVKQRL